MRVLNVSLCASSIDYPKGNMGLIDHSLSIEHHF